MRICSLCNGLSEWKQNCPDCGRPLVDGGPLADYFGPYSPYMNRDSLTGAEHGCIHLLFCPRCGFDTRQCSPEVEV